MNKPFVKDLPVDGDEYVSILNKNNASVLKSGLVTLQPGESVGSHSTENKEELIIILEGKGVVETEQEGKIEISKGQIAFNPVQTEHNVTNTGENVLRYIYVVAQSV